VPHLLRAPHDCKRVWDVFPVAQSLHPIIAQTYL